MANSFGVIYAKQFGKGVLALVSQNILVHLFHTMLHQIFDRSMSAKQKVGIGVKIDNALLILFSQVVGGLQDNVE